MSVTIGFFNGEGKEAVRHTLLGGHSGRVMVFLLLAAFLVLGISLENLLIAIPFGIATALATVSLAQAWRSNHAARRLERPHPPANL